jgi:cytochrome b
MTESSTNRGANFITAFASKLAFGQTSSFTMTHTTRIWDLPTRLFHWSLLVCVIGLVATGLTGGGWMVWHFRFGFGVLTLLLFRIVWGLVGGHYSRFSSFIYAPGTVIAYLKGQGKPEHSAGHNPLGAGSVFAMLALLIAQVSTGLMADDEIANAGPLAKFVSGSVVSAVTSYHKTWGKYILITLILVHIAAILFYRIKKRENLIAPMIGGDKNMASLVPASVDTFATRMGALAVFAICAASVAWMVKVTA